MAESGSADAMQTHIVIDGLPVVPPEKKELFIKMLRKKVSEKLGGIDSFKINLASNESTGLVEGAFLEFARPADADTAVAILNKFKFTKSDEFKVDSWNIWRRLQELPDEYEEPEINEDAAASDLTNTMMNDERARQQFIVKGGASYDVEWFWMDPQTCKPDLYRKPSSTKEDVIGQWTQVDRRSKRLQPGLPKTLPMWSPNGTYIVAQCSAGVRLHGGPSMALVLEVLQADIEAVAVSPSEKFFVVKSKGDLTVYDIQQGSKIRSLYGLVTDEMRWPILKFSCDDSYCAVIADANRLSIYHSASMRLIQSGVEVKKYTIEIPDINGFEWSPTNPMQAAYTTEGTKQVGWRVSVVSIDVYENIASVESLCNRNFFNATRVDMLWHPDGSALAAKISKPEKVEYCLFRVGHSLVSAEQLVVPGTAVRFAWQPTAARFAVIVESGKKGSLMIYNVVKSGFKACTPAIETTATSIFWAPKGNRLVLANMDKSTLEFFGVTEGKNEVVSFAKETHPYVTNCEWDPSGRYFCSFSSALKAQMDTRYVIFNINGVRLVDQKIERLSHVSFRPFAPTVLTTEEVNSVKRNLSKLGDKFMAEEQKVAMEKEEKERATIKKLEDKYVERMQQIHQYHAEKNYAAIRERLRRSAPALRRQQEQMRKVADQTVTETRTEEEIISETPIRD